MKPLSSIEQIALTLSLAVVCAMATTRCSHADSVLSVDLNKPGSSIGRTVWTAGNASGYSVGTIPHYVLGFAAYYNLAQMPSFNHAALFLVSFSASVMVRLDDVEAFAPASYLDYLSANHVIQSNHPHFAVNDSTSINNLGVNHD